MFAIADGLIPGSDSFAQILSAIAGGVTVQDRTGRLVYANEAAAQIIGYPTAEALLAAPLPEVTARFELLDAEGRPISTQALPNWLVLQGAPEAGARVGYRIRETGAVRWSLLRARPLRGADGTITHVVNIFQDITAQTEAEAAIQAARARFRFLAEASSLLAGSLDYPTTLTQIAQLAVPRIADWCSLDLLDADGQLQRLAVTHVDPARVAWAHEIHRRYPPDPAAANGPYQVLRTGQSEFYPEISDAMLVAGARDTEHLEISRALGLTALMIVPVSARNQPLGVLTLASAESNRHFTADDLALAEDLAGRAGLAIDNARLYQAADAARQELMVTLQSIGDAVIATDANGRVRFLNPVAEELTGWSAAAAQGQLLEQVFVIIHEETREPVANPLERVLREGVIVGLTNHTALVARDGTTRSIDDSGAPMWGPDGTITGAVLVFRDVTRRRHAEVALQLIADAGARLHSSLETSVILQRLAELLVPRFADWCVVEQFDANGVLQEQVLHHRDPARVAWARTMRARYPADRNPAGGLRRALETGRGQALFSITDELLAAGASDPAELAYMREYGVSSVLWVPLRTHEQTLGVLTLAYSESGRKYYPDDLLVAEEIGRRAARALENAALYETAQAAIRTRDQFLMLAAHELKTPLTTVLAGLQLIARRQERAGGFTPGDQRTWQMVRGQAERLNRLILTLLDLSRIQTGQLELDRGPLDLDALARRLVEELGPGLEMHVLSYEGPATPAWIEGDALRLEQALHNLLMNAVKYSPLGGKIQMQVTTNPQEVCVSVADEGIGIQLDAQKTLFTRFYRAPNARAAGISGVGIGLNVVKEIVTLHGGRVAVESTEGVGSTFTLCFPRREPAAPPPPPASTPSAGTGPEAAPPAPHEPGQA